MKPEGGEDGESFMFIRAGSCCRKVSGLTPSHDLMFIFIKPVGSAWCLLQKPEKSREFVSALSRREEPMKNLSLVERHFHKPSDQGSSILFF
ncbi:hypothetical protein KOW79_011047 [Hemibagrus wyckioides]|uniref:Uncharacterized protein n=1 Tax=Hemibagrus wyckioides TaxID=337641 RepID=A0A9D3NJK0_9TELE|nr:hypothetical protein KOW79_011047 [Hemibagrus wyckioides]